VRRKRYIQVAGNPDFTPPIPPNTVILNPLDGSGVFARFPAIKNSRLGIDFPEGDVILRHGRHIGPNQGFGLVHIWQEHFLTAADLTVATPMVTTYLLDCLRVGAAIHWEGGMGREHRAMIARLAVGAVIVELRNDADNDPNYSIVTGIPGGQTKGPLIGGLK
jgi:hypothetical protein